MPSFKCKDVGMNCEFMVNDEKQDELLHIIGHHFEKTHDMKTIPPDTMEKIKKVIKPPVTEVLPGRHQHQKHNHH